MDLGDNWIWILVTVVTALVGWALASHRRIKRREGLDAALERVAILLDARIHERVPSDPIEEGETGSPQGLELRPISLGSEKEFKYVKELELDLDGWQARVVFPIRVLPGDRRRARTFRYTDLLWEPRDVRLFDFLISNDPDEPRNFETGDADFDACFRVSGPDPDALRAFLDDDVRAAAFSLADRFDGRFEAGLPTIFLRIRCATWPEDQGALLLFIEECRRICDRYLDVARGGG